MTRWGTSTRWRDELRDNGTGSSHGLRRTPGILCLRKPTASSRFRQALWELWWSLGVALGSHCVTQRIVLWGRSRDGSEFARGNRSVDTEVFCNSQMTLHSGLRWLRATPRCFRWNGRHGVAGESSAPNWPLAIGYLQSPEGWPIARCVAVAGLTRPQVTPAMWAQGRSAAVVGDGSAAPARCRPGSGPVQAWGWPRGRQPLGNHSDVDRIHIGVVAYQLATG